MVRRGFDLGGDFIVSGLDRDVFVSSEHVGMRAEADQLTVYYSDMGHERVEVRTTDFEEARTVFVDHLAELGRHRGRAIDEQGLRR